MSLVPFGLQENRERTTFSTLEIKKHLGPHIHSTEITEAVSNLFCKILSTSISSESDQSMIDKYKVARVSEE